MNTRAVLFVLGNLLLVLALCLLAPLVVAIFDTDNPHAGREILGFVITLTLMVALGIGGRYAFRSSAEQVRVREGFAIVTFAWVAAVLFGMLPYLISGTCGTVTDAFFETMSGFTTTGATIFPRVEVIPRGVQFWRCMTQWLGGMGIVVLSVALLPALGAGGYRMLKAESPGGVAFERERPRITDTAKDLWRLYLLLSGTEVVLLRLAGMSWYDSFCHTFTTMSTGGFSPHSESIGFFPSPWIQWIIIVFMFAAGVNFSLHAQILRGRVRTVARNPELRLYVSLTAAGVVLGLLAVSSAGGLEKSLRDVVFQVVSIGTTTGFATADYDTWPQIMRLVLVLMMFVGGCMGSTGGGMKVARLIIFAKALMREMHRPIFPHAVRHIRVGVKVMDPSLVANILAFGILFAITFVVGALVMALCGYDLVTSLSASAAAVGNIGPGLGEVGPTQTWAHLPAAAKWIMSIIMLAGRLELYSVLILLTPWVWRR
jgi:trk system potassium uptake protein TrkH